MEGVSNWPKEEETENVKKPEEEKKQIKVEELRYNEVTEQIEVVVAVEPKKERIQPTTMLLPNRAPDSELNMDVQVSSAVEAPKKDRISRASL